MPRADYFEAGVTPGCESIDVLVDGAPQPHCVKAHRGQGWATVRIWLNGDYVRDGLNRPKEITLKGKVEFRRSCQ